MTKTGTTVGSRCRGVIGGVQYLYADKAERAGHFHYSLFCTILVWSV